MLQTYNELLLKIFQLAGLCCAHALTCDAKWRVQRKGEIRMKNKFVSIVLAALMVVTMTAGCGASEPEASPTSNPGTENQTGTGAAGDVGNQSVTPAPETSADAGNQSVTPAPETSADAPKQVLTLDYDELDAWIKAGFMGTSPSGKEVLLGLNEGWNYGILIVTDDSDMTVFGYEGASERSYDDSIDYGHITIADQVFGYKERSDGVWDIDMGDDIGVTRIDYQTKFFLMERIKEIIKDYTPVD
ncbi:MAG: hypothetical protein J1E35_01425 [Lachnospiraceae bacterium]|nr:hypothetical protein [Lachnospiraceae bacterium]